VLSVETISIVFTGLSISLAAFYYISTLRNAQRNQQLQLETRQAQLFLQLYNRYRDDTRELDIAKSFLEVEIESFNDLIRLLETDKDFHKTLDVLGGFYEGIGVMVKEGYMPVRLVALQWAGITKRFWEKLKPFMSDLREYRGFPRGWSETEYLYNELMKYLEEHPELQT
jgi:hypothetical protein